MVRVFDCHAGVLGSNPGGPKIFPLGITSLIKEIPKGKIFGSARILTQNSCVTVDHSNHVAKELTQHEAVRSGTVTTLFMA